MTLSIEVQSPTDASAKSSTVELPGEIFDAKTNVSLIHQVVVAQLAAARQGTHSTKTRGEVRGGGKKPYRQKGTGRARQGSTRAPQFAGGGIVHGPQPRKYDQRTPKKMKAAALRGALSDRARNGRVFVVSSLVSGEVPSTRAAAVALAKVSEARNVLIVAERSDELTWKSARNLTGVHLLEPTQLNTYDVLISDDLVFTQGALEAFLAGPAKGKWATGAATESEAVSVEAAPAIDVAKPAKTVPAEKVAADKAPAKKVAADKAPAKKVAAEKAPAKKAAKKAAAEVVDDEAADKLAKKAAASDAPAPKVGDAPYGRGSHVALENGEQPEGFPVKGNADSMLYHIPGSPFYDRTVAEVWFASPAAAEKAGFDLPPSQHEAAAEGSDD